METREFQELIRTVEALRNPQGGCPWDLKQDHISLLPCLLEETYELMDAVGRGDGDNTEEELGDVLLQVLLHCQIAKEAGHFDLESVSRRLREKLIRRHPHVFGDQKAEDAQEALGLWEAVKKSEGEEGGPVYRMGKKELMAPALCSSLKLGQAAAQANFDWDGPEQVSYKVEEEWQELKEELAPQRGPNNRERMREEMGDLLFSCAQLARHLRIDPEEALGLANRKFIRRFNAMEDRLRERGLPLEDLTLKELDVHWDAVKAQEVHETS